LKSSLSFSLRGSLLRCPFDGAVSTELVLQTIFATHEALFQMFPA
jgi:hypothetical protein